MAFRHIVVSQAAKLSYKNRHLIIQINAETNQFPLEDIHTIVVSTTRAVVTTYLLSKLIEYNVKIVFCDPDHNPCGELGGYFQNVNRNVSISNQIAWNDGDKVQLWDALVRAKIESEIMFAHSLGQDTTDMETELGKIEFGDSTNREAVVARKYFTTVFGPDFTRDQDNAINAGMNYGYSVLLSCFNQEIEAQGYLTQLGIHHKSVKNDFNLSSDLMEPFRTLVDLIVYQHKNQEFDDLFKYDLIDVLNMKIEYDGKSTYLENVIYDLVRESVSYLNGSQVLPKYLVNEYAG